MKNYHGWKIWLVMYDGGDVCYRVISPAEIGGQGRMTRAEWDALPDWMY